ncbi:hypothetical protein C8F01DRAFT_1233022 [Mycena amicta]|nr:hypothetical protein C8F01DRAFT_1233022 [Mycena amicta]
MVDVSDNLRANLRPTGRVTDISLGNFTSWAPALALLPLQRTLAVKVLFDGTVLKMMICFLSTRNVEHQSPPTLVFATGSRPPVELAVDPPPSSPTPMTSVLAEPPDVRLLFGPFLIGLVFNAILYGVVVVQFFIYYDRYKGDRRWLRYLVIKFLRLHANSRTQHKPQMIYLLLAETINTAFDTSLVYEPLVARWGQTEALQKSPLFLRPDAAVTVAISTPVQLFMAWRLRALTKQSIFPAIILLLALVSLAGGLSVTINVSLKPDYSSFDGFRPFVTTWLVASAACDVVLSGALIYSLRVRKTGVGATDRYVDRIIRVTIQTGSITAITALLDLFVFLFAPTATLQFIWDFPLSKLYSNAVLSSVNSRPWKEDPATHFTMNVLFEPTPSDGQSSGLVRDSSICLKLNRVENSQEFAHNEMLRATELHQRTRRLPTAAFESAVSEPRSTIETVESSQSPNFNLHPKDTEAV